MTTRMFEPSQELKDSGVIRIVTDSENKQIAIEHEYGDKQPIVIPYNNGKKWYGEVRQQFRSAAEKYFASEDIILQLERQVGSIVLELADEIVGNVGDVGNIDDGGGGEEDDDDEEKKKQRAKVALELAEKHSKELFVNEFGRAFAAIQVDDHTEIHPMDERRFKNWLSNIYYKQEDDLLSDDDLKKSIRILEAKAEFDSGVRKHRLDVRVRGYSKQREDRWLKQTDNYQGYELGDEDEDTEDFDEIYYDLTNLKWEAVKITADGWEIVKNPPILFRRYGGERAQPHPNRNYDKNVLNKFLGLLNVKNQDHITILKGKLPSQLWPTTTPKFVLMEPAAHGSGKTTMFELIKDSIDPNTTKTASLPGEIFNLKQYLAHNYISFFDNVSNISDEQSDTLCRAVTGSGDMKRKLYENDEDIIYNYRRIVGLNGINNAATRPDLLDRGVIIELEKIDRQNRKLLRTIKRDYNKLKADLLGFYLDIIVEVLKERKKHRDTDPDFYGLKDLVVQTGGLPRMADAAILSEQIAAKVAEKMGESYQPGDFLNALNRNLETLNVEALKESLVAEAMITFMTDMETFKKGIDKKKHGDNYPHWEGSPTNLLGELNEFIDTHQDIKINTRSKAWPQDPAVFGKELRRISPNLAALGIKIETKRTEYNVLYNISKMPTVPTVPTGGPKSSLDPWSKSCREPCKQPTAEPTGVPTGDKGQNHAQNDPAVGNVGNVSKKPYEGGFFRVGGNTGKKRLEDEREYKILKAFELAMSNYNEGKALGATAGSMFTAQDAWFHLNTAFPRQKWDISKVRSAIREQARKGRVITRESDERDVYYLLWRDDNGGNNNKSGDDNGGVIGIPAGDEVANE
jgi:hypothetical protein